MSETSSAYAYIPTANVPLWPPLSPVSPGTYAAMSPMSPTSGNYLPMSPTSGNYLPMSPPSVVGASLPNAVGASGGGGSAAKRRRKASKKRSTCAVTEVHRECTEYTSGSYDPYYHLRYMRVAEIDVRLAMILETFGSFFFVQKRVLEIGCNSGFIVFYIGAYLRASHVTGVDIDSSIILKNTSQLRKFKHDGINVCPRNPTKDDTFPEILLKRNGPAPYCNKPWRIDNKFTAPAAPQHGALTFPFNVEFQWADYSIPQPVGLYDVVICFKTAKYVFPVNHLLENILRANPATVITDASLELDPELFRKQRIHTIFIYHRI